MGGGEPEERGSVKSQRIVLGRHKTRIKKSEVRSQNWKLSCSPHSVFCVLFSVLVEDKSGFWCVAKA